MKHDILTILRFTWRKFRYSPRYHLLLLGGCVISAVIIALFHLILQDAARAWFVGVLVSFVVLVCYYMILDTYKE